MVRLKKQSETKPLIGWRANKIRWVSRKLRKWERRSGADSAKIAMSRYYKAC